jgi:hypothetical protein
MNLNIYLFFKLCVILLMINCVQVFSQDTIKTKKTLNLTSRQLDSIEYAINLKKYPRYKFNFKAGGFLPFLDGSIVVNGDKLERVGTKLDFEEGLGLTQSIVTYRLDGLYNFSRKSTFTATFFVMNRNSDRVLNDSIEFGNYKFNANTKFSFLLDYTYLGINYIYNFVAQPQFTTGASAGLRLFRIRSSGTGEVTINSEKVEKSYDESLLAPGFVLGLNNSVYFLPNLQNRSSIEYFSIKVGTIKATLFEANIGLEYYFHTNFGVGVLATANLLTVTSDSDEGFNGEVNFNFKGITLFLSARF